jgi:hypothetical protein
MKNPASSASPAALSILIGADGQPLSDNGDTFIDGVGLRRLFGGVSHMWAKRQMTRDATFPRPRYVGIYPYWSLGALLAVFRRRKLTL